MLWGRTVSEGDGAGGPGKNTGGTKRSGNESSRTGRRAGCGLGEQRSRCWFGTQATVHEGLNRGHLSPVRTSLGRQGRCRASPAQGWNQRVNLGRSGAGSQGQRPGGLSATRGPQSRHSAVVPAPAPSFQLDPVTRA